jgi:thiamine biosynthesis lipoprotein
MKLISKISPQKLVFLLASVLVVIIAVLILIWTNLSGIDNGYECTNSTMNTLVQQTVYGNKREAAATAAAKNIGELETLISWNIEDSDIAKLNAAAGSVWTSIDKKTTNLLQQCLDVAQKSNGAYDPTILTISALWDFGGYNQHVPSKEDISRFLPYVNYEDLRVKTENSSASLKMHYMGIDLSSIEKGAACDEAIAAYKTAKVESGIVAVGSSVGVYGTKRDRSPWQIAVRDPKGTSDKATAIGLLDLTSGFASTISSYEKQFKKDGVTYPAILNPDTGYPENNGLVSVTVTGSGGAISDALANACFVLGIEKGKELLKQYRAGAVFIDENNQVTVTDNLKSRLHLTSNSYKLING